jgi:hypothetical protein
MRFERPVVRRSARADAHSRREMNEPRRFEVCPKRLERISRMACWLAVFWHAMGPTLSLVRSAAAGEYAVEICSATEHRRIVVGRDGREVTPAPVRDGSCCIEYCCAAVAAPPPSAMRQVQRPVGETRATVRRDTCDTPTCTTAFVGRPRAPPRARHC